MSPQDRRPQSISEARSDTRDSKRAFRWGIAVVVALVLLVLLYNLFMLQR
ncbi:hypothetical protein [Variovorax sp.]|nr:hypothetical protein [Variovorax sp.]HYP85740.1 hypothetical protein [Variovorax sp.]